MVTIGYEFTGDEIAAVQHELDEQETNPFVAVRRARNVEGDPPEVTRDRIWYAHLIGIMTTRQASGPDSAVGKFMRHQRTDLSPAACRAAPDTEQHVVQTLQASPYGVSYHSRIGKACATNLALLDRNSGEGWTELERALDRLVQQRRANPSPSHARAEREVAELLDDQLLGEGLHYIGQKQARNMLQVLGLTRYELPLDSRVNEWASEHFDLPPFFADHSLSEYYAVGVNLMQTACAEAGVLPCIFDAAAFTDADTDIDRATIGAGLP